MSDILAHTTPSVDDVVARVIDRTREQVLLNRVNITSIAEKAGVNRNTVSRNLRLRKDTGKRDIPYVGLNVMVAACQENGLDPVQVLADALAALTDAMRRKETRDGHA